MSVFVWGSNKHGELGINSADNISVPTLIDSFDGNPLCIASGEGHSLIVMDNGDLYSFGRGREGQLGIKSSRNNLYEPRKIIALQHEYVIGTAAGSMTSYAITESGNVYQWYHNFCYSI